MHCNTLSTRLLIWALFALPVSSKHCNWLVWFAMALFNSPFCLVNWTIKFHFCNKYYPIPLVWLDTTKQRRGGGQHPPTLTSYIYNHLVWLHSEFSFICHTHFDLIKGNVIHAHIIFYLLIISGWLSVMNQSECGVIVLWTPFLLIWIIYDDTQIWWDTTQNYPMLLIYRPCYQST